HGPACRSFSWQSCSRAPLVWSSRRARWPPPGRNSEPDTMTTVPGRRRRWTIRLTLVGAAVSLAIIAWLPVTTRQGINFEVAVRQVPLYLKVFEFLDRNTQYRQLATEITHGATSDR